ncbi:MAG: hypothetical protein BJ554DRAFT_7568 [Olpidium bornovanus]|uniref:Uncharacterized protein n=1 Tax=Olpidium bornovanus TaxID=278681 RepID=A0A8H7ZVR6_9FUNG|nr:MAG: hypothetical protein BJ554DRAFT_7568 [Olpidium bornovanus]
MPTIARAGCEAVDEGCAGCVRRRPVEGKGRADGDHSEDLGRFFASGLPDRHVLVVHAAFDDINRVPRGGAAAPGDAGAETEDEVEEQTVLGPQRGPETFRPLGRRRREAASGEAGGRRGRGRKAGNFRRRRNRPARPGRRTRAPAEGSAPEFRASPHVQGPVPNAGGGGGPGGGCRRQRRRAGKKAHHSPRALRRLQQAAAARRRRLPVPLRKAVLLQPPVLGPPHLHVRLQGGGPHRDRPREPVRGQQAARTAVAATGWDVVKIAEARTGLGRGLPCFSSLPPPFPTIFIARTFTIDPQAIPNERTTSTTLDFLLQISHKGQHKPPMFLTLETAVMCKHA